jgi:hypothetical protein
VVEIVTVRAVESEGRILSEAGADAIGPGAPAVEEMHDDGEMRLAVRIRTPPDHGASERSWPSCSPSRSWCMPPAPTRPPTSWSTSSCRAPRPMRDPVDDRRSRIVILAA